MLLWTRKDWLFFILLENVSCTLTSQSLTQDTSRHDRAEQKWLLITHTHTHTHTHTPSKPGAKAFHKLKNGSPIWCELSKTRKGQLWPAEMALPERSITTLLQQANAYHIVITRFIFGLGILCKQAFGVRGTFPSSPVFKRSNSTRVHASSVVPLSTGYSLRQSLLIALNQEAVFSAVRWALEAFTHTSGSKKLWMQLVVMSPSWKRGESESYLSQLPAR